MPTDESIWTQSVPYVQDGDPVNALVTNAPTQVLADRTAALKRIIDAIEAGEQLLFRDAPLAAGLNVGTVVYFDSTSLVHNKAIAKWRSLSEGGTEAYPANTAIYVGVIIEKTSSYVGNILINGFAVLDASGLTNLFGSSSPESGVYYLSMGNEGTVELAPPAMRVRVLEYSTGGVIRVFPPQHEPITHTHTHYRLRKDDWVASGTFDPTIVPTGIQYGYDLTAACSVEQNITNAIVPTVGDPSFVYLYHSDDCEGSSSGEACDLGGLHVDETSISIDENGIWWTPYAPPDCDIDMLVTSADTHGLSFINSIRTLSPNSLYVSESNGLVSLRIEEMAETLDEGGHIVVKDISNFVKKKGPVVSSFNVGTGLARTSAQGGGVGDIVLELELFNNLMLEASIQNLNNAVTSTEDPHVITLFPDNRTSSVACRVVLPNTESAGYYAKIYAQFLSPGSSQAPPTISVSLVPTPNSAGVTPTVASSDTFPNFPSSVSSGNAYYVESNNSYDLSGYSRGVISFTLSSSTPSPALRMLNAGVRLYIP